MPEPEVVTRPEYLHNNMPPLLEASLNPDGTGDQKNGDGCYYKQRPYKNIVAVVRPSWKLVADKEVKSTVKAV